MMSEAKRPLENLDGQILIDEYKRALIEQTRLCEGLTNPENREERRKNLATVRAERIGLETEIRLRLAGPRKG